MMANQNNNYPMKEWHFDFKIRAAGGKKQHDIMIPELLPGASCG
jgi:hypothetical protein